MVENLQAISERIDAELARKNELRDRTLARSRELIRFCANSIRAPHRHEYDGARQLLAEAQAAAKTMRDETRPHADIYYAGYVQDALKEMAEAAITLAVVNHKPLPNPEDLEVEYPAYLNGLGEAMGEIRRFVRDSMRRDELAEAEGLLEVMDDVYSYLVTVDYPDALTAGLRRTTDMVRGVLERTRGDLTTAVREEQLQAALRKFEERFNARVPSEPTDG